MFDIYLATSYLSLNFVLRFPFIKSTNIGFLLMMSWWMNPHSIDNSIDYVSSKDKWLICDQPSMHICCFSKVHALTHMYPYPCYLILALVGCFTVFLVRSRLLTWHHTFLNVEVGTFEWLPVSISLLESRWILNVLGLLKYCLELWNSSIGTFRLLHHLKMTMVHRLLKARSMQ